MNAIDERYASPLQAFGRGHVGEYHEFFDQSVSVEALGRDDAIHRIVRGQDDLTLRKLEIEGLAFVAGVLQAAIGGVQRFED